MFRKLLPLLIMVLLMCGCSAKKQVYQTVYLDVFDTVTTVRGYDTSEKAFNENAARVHAALLEYHRLFDIYHDTPMGIKAVNDAAGGDAVSVNPEIIALLEDCRAYYELTGGRVNIALGSVLQLWHEAREFGMEHPEKAALPDAQALDAAAAHCSFDSVSIDREARTVQITDPLLRLDVGAVAKGWTAQKVSQLLPEGYLLNLGGNIVARGSKDDGSAWVIGIQSPEDESTYCATVSIRDCSAVTSGDYQRYYTVNGQRYHHIIDPDTRMPSEYWRSVTVLCADSGLGDCLSTALFLMPLEEGKALAKKCGAEAMWIDAAGNEWRTEGFA